MARHGASPLASQPHCQYSFRERLGQGLHSGALLKVAEEAAVDLLFTTDQRIRYQQNLTGRKIAIVVLTGTTKWSRVRLHLERIAAVVGAATPASYTEIPFPFS
jgi:hypothetical protein